MEAVFTQFVLRRDLRIDWVGADMIGDGMMEGRVEKGNVSGVG